MIFLFQASLTSRRRKTLGVRCYSSANNDIYIWWTFRAWWCLMFWFTLLTIECYFMNFKDSWDKVMRQWYADLGHIESTSAMVYHWISTYGHNFRLEKFLTESIDDVALYWFRFTLYFAFTLRVSLSISTTATASPEGFNGIPTLRVFKAYGHAT